MKNKFLFSIAALSVALLTFSGCNDDIDYGIDGEGQGRVLITPYIYNDVVGTVTEKASRKAPSRAGVANDELAANTIVWISNNQGVVRKFNGVGQIPDEGIWLLSGNYIAEAWAGDSVSASWTDKYFKAREQFTVTNGGTLQLNLECKIANVLVKVEYDKSVQDIIVDPKLVAGHKRGTLEYNGFTPEYETGYFMMPSYDKNIAYTFTAKSTDGTDVKLENVIENAKSGYLYTLKVSHRGAETPEGIGGAMFTIEVDESEIEVEDPILIESAPVISGLTFDINSTIVGEPDKMQEQKVWIQSLCEITKVEVIFPEAFDGLGIGGHDFEIFGMSGSVASKLDALGFIWKKYTHTEEAENPEFEEVKLVFGTDLLNMLPIGNTTITIKATDKKGRVGTREIHILISDASVEAVRLSATSPDVWPTQLTLTGTVLKEGATGLGFEWREAGTQQWNFIASDADASAKIRHRSRALSVGDKYTALLTGLNPATEYEYRSVCDGYESTEIFSIATEAAAQLPNASFEDVAKFKQSIDKKDITHFAKDINDLFWDCGNHGSMTLNKEVTESATDKKHSGQKSVKLCSQFVGVGTIGKFAAGNIFVGQYIGTEGTDGVLGFGRPFTSRPKAVRVWVHYTPGTVEYNPSNISDVTIGQPDKGIIYAAIMGEAKMDYEGTKWPCVVKTKTAELFDKNPATNSQLIAYAEMMFTEATAGSDMVQVEIPFEYFRTDMKACNIILTASASKGGDYFAGGNSVMYLDDFELVY